MAVTHPAAVANRWQILAAVAGVILMTPLDSSAVNIVIPIMQQEFAIPLGYVAWVSLIYLLLIASLILPVGRLGDIIGFRRLFLLGVAVFTGASLLCGLAPTPNWLIAARAVQGIGASLMMALSPGITTAIFPPQERGRALGFTGMAIAIGLVLGPTVGGLLTANYGWRWIFFINLPIGLIGGYMCWRLLPPLAPSARHAIDWLGGVLAVLGLGSLMLVLTLGQGWGWTSGRILGLSVLFLAATVAFFITEHRHPAPMLNLALFRNPVFAGGNFATAMNYLAQLCALFLTPLLLQRGLGYSTEQAGITMAALPVFVLLLAPLSGALSDRIGTRALAIAGELLVTAGLGMLAVVVARGHWALILAALALIGMGTGLFQSPNNSAVMGSVPRAFLGIGGSVLATMRNIGMALGIAVSSAVVSIVAQRYLGQHPGQTQQALITGVRLGYCLGASFALIGAFTSAIRADTPAAGAR